VHRALMRCYCGMGNRSAALKQFQTCAQLLHNELNVPPAPDTVALYEQIRQSDAPAQEATVTASPASTPAQRAAVIDEAIKRLRQADYGLRRTRRDLRAGTEAIRRILND
jgi:DNA-binding SARP family transcriptional activator